VYLCNAPMLRRLLLCVSLLVSLAAIAAERTDEWLEIASPHFVVISNSAEVDARRTARQFERMRSAFQKIFPDANLDTSAPITVLAVEDKANMVALEPPAYLGNGKMTIAGLFVRAPEKVFILIHTNSPGLHPYAAVYHEYTHFVMNRTGDWMPLWLAEGLAEYYQNTEIYDDEIRIGKVDAFTVDFLQQKALLPLTTLLTVDTHSPYYHEEDKGSMFYSESWALAHYLKTKDNEENTHRVDDYLQLMHKGVDNVTAATRAFGDLTQLQTDLQKYILNTGSGYASLPSSNQVDDSGFVERKLTKAESDTVRAEFQGYVGRGEDARSLLEPVLRDDPGNLRAHVTMGYVAFRERKYDESHQWCQQAVQLDANDFMAQFCSAISWLRKGVIDAGSLAHIENELRAVIRLNPNFAPGYDALGTVMGMRGKNFSEARMWMEKAVQLEPGDVAIRVNKANLLTRMGQNTEAIEELEFAQKLSHTPEEVATVENILQSAQRFQVERAKLQKKTAAVAISPVGQQSRQPGVTMARATHTVQAEYTEEARNAKREGTCTLSLIVGVDGKPSNIVVTKKLGMGLDQKAIEAVRQWQFEPARRNGRPIPSGLILTIRFNLFGGGADKFVELSEKAKEGDPAAELELANAFFAGRDVPKNENQGLALLERAAEGGLPQAQFELAEHTYGDGTNSANYVDAYVWYTRSQRGGYAASEAKIGELESRMTEEQSAEARKRLESLSSPAAK
jgi:TonB family protein